MSDRRTGIGGATEDCQLGAQAGDFLKFASMEAVRVAGQVLDNRSCARKFDSPVFVQIADAHRAKPFLPDVWVIENFVNFGNSAFLRHRAKGDFNCLARPKPQPRAYRAGYTMIYWRVS
jgi:hypothetical protein